MKFSLSHSCRYLYLDICYDDFFFRLFEIVIFSRFTHTHTHTQNCWNLERNFILLFNHEPQIPVTAMIQREFRKIAPRYIFSFVRLFVRSQRLLIFKSWLFWRYHVIWKSKSEFILSTFTPCSTRYSNFLLRFFWCARFGWC